MVVMTTTGVEQEEVRIIGIPRSVADCAIGLIAQQHGGVFSLVIAVLARQGNEEQQKCDCHQRRSYTQTLSPAVEFNPG
jgi:hypothetical protein